MAKRQHIGCRTQVSTRWRRYVCVTWLLKSVRRRTRGNELAIELILLVENGICGVLHLFPQLVVNLVDFPLFHFDVLHTFLNEVARSAEEKGGQSPFVLSTLRAVPANGDCPPFSGRPPGITKCYLVIDRDAAAVG